MAKIQAVLLDLDGTLIDAFAPIVRAMNQTLFELGLPQLTELEIRRHTGKGDCSMSSLFGEQKEAAGKRFIEIHDEDYFTGISPLSGASEILDFLQSQNIPTAIVTSKGQLRAEQQIHHLGWQDKVHSIVGKIDGRPSKPDPEPLLLASANIQIDIQSCIMIGDGIADMKAAKRAGCPAIALSHSFSDSELKEAGASMTFSSLDKVQTWLITQIN